MKDWKHNPELWEFPCQFPFKVMGINSDDFVNKVIAEIQKHAPDNYTPKVKPSSEGKYLSVSVTIHLQSKEQLETLYTELNKVDGVKIIL